MEHFPELPGANVDEQEMRKGKGKIGRGRERENTEKEADRRFQVQYNELDRRQLFFKPMPRHEESRCERVLELQH